MSIKNRQYLASRRAIAAVSTIAILLLPGFLLAQTVGAANNESEAAEISRAQFTTLVTAREPVDTLTTTNTAIGKLYFFTEVKNMTGKVFIHRWRYFDEVVAEIPFSIKGPRWRVNSYKNFTASMSGEWSVELIDDKGNHYGKHAILVSASGRSDNNRASSGIDRIKKLFPDAQYTLSDDSPDKALCPPSGFYQWKKGDQQRWTLDMGKEHQHIRIYNASKNTVALQADPGLSGPDSVVSSAANCQMYAAHHFNATTAELVTEMQADCNGESNDVFSANSLRRQADQIELMLFADQRLVCRYRIN